MGLKRSRSRSPARRSPPEPKETRFMGKIETRHAAVSGYAVHRVDLARSRHGISVTGEALDDPPVARFKAAPGMSFFKAGSSEKKKIVGVTDKHADVIEAESVVIDAAMWEVSPGPPPSSTEYGLVKVSSKIYAADMLADDPRCEVLLSANDAWWSPLPRPPFRDRIVKLAAYLPCRGLLISTENGETCLFNRHRRRRSSWVALPGSPAPPAFEGATVFAKDHGVRDRVRE
nr:unnamed protein product [Digitaria exilis]